MTHASCRVCISFILVVAALLALPPSATRAGTTGTLGGFVFAKSGAAIKGARVSATSPSQITVTTTDATGHFVFASLIPDDYTVTASSDGYQASSQPGVLVSADATQQIEFALEPAVKTLARVTVSETTAGLLKPGTTQSMYTI
ncbi:MAG: carboxypeptidase regulatory-like domain-containing protein, partial [Candidatus Eremiobacteraeota bacterium]|nr:carboxypeptidase regulatory-like domain-containing protein [Candidatus Eremiobacteraeota bacterium]